MVDPVVALDSKLFNDYRLEHNSLYIIAESIICSHILLIILVEYIFILHKKIMKLR